MRTHPLAAAGPWQGPVPLRLGVNSRSEHPGTALTPTPNVLHLLSGGAVGAGVPMPQGGRVGHAAEPCLPGSGWGGRRWGVGASKASRAAGA